MYLATFASWVILFVGQFQTFTLIKGDYADGSQYSLREGWPSMPDCGGTIVLTFNVRTVQRSCASFHMMASSYPCPTGFPRRWYRMVEGVGVVEQEAVDLSRMLHHLTCYSWLVVVFLLPSPHLQLIATS